jgi:hypothetical protein
MFGDKELIFEWTAHPIRQYPGKTLLFWIARFDCDARLPLFSSWNRFGRSATSDRR